MDGVAVDGVAVDRVGVDGVGQSDRDIRYVHRWWPEGGRLGVRLRLCMDLGIMVGVLRGWQRALRVLGWP